MLLALKTKAKPIPCQHWAYAPQPCAGCPLVMLSYPELHHKQYWKACMTKFKGSMPTQPLLVAVHASHACMLYM